MRVLKNVLYIVGMVLLWASSLIVIGAASRVMWWLLGIGWSVL